MSSEEKKMTAANLYENADELKCVALGEEDISEEIAYVEPQPENMSTEHRLSTIEQRLLYVTNAIDSLFQIVKHLRDKSDEKQDEMINKTIEKKKNEQKVEIPENTMLYASSRGLSYFCRVGLDGFYIGEKRYESLSAAAEAVSGVRRSGWTFWKMPDGRTVKEIYKG